MVRIVKYISLLFAIKGNIRTMNYPPPLIRPYDRTSPSIGAKTLIDATLSILHAIHCNHRLTQAWYLCRPMCAHWSLPIVHPHASPSHCNRYAFPCFTFSRRHDSSDANRSDVKIPCLNYPRHDLGASCKVCA